MGRKKEEIVKILDADDGWVHVQRIVMEHIKSEASRVEDLRRLMAHGLLVARCKGNDETTKDVIVNVLTKPHREVCAKYYWDLTQEDRIDGQLQEVRRSIIEGYKAGANRADETSTGKTEEEFWEVVRVVPALLKEVEGTHEGCGQNET